MSPMIDARIATIAITAQDSMLHSVDSNGAYASAIGPPDCARDSATDEVRQRDECEAHGDHRRDALDEVRHTHQCEPRNERYEHSLPAAVHEEADADRAEQHRP